jgi:hypothetical protein
METDMYLIEMEVVRQQAYTAEFLGLHNPFAPPHFAFEDSDDFKKVHNSLVSFGYDHFNDRGAHSYLSKDRRKAYGYDAKHKTWNYIHPEAGVDTFIHTPEDALNHIKHHSDDWRD